MKRENYLYCTFFYMNRTESNTTVYFTLQLSTMYTRQRVKMNTSKIQKVKKNVLTLQKEINLALVCLTG